MNRHILTFNRVMFAIGAVVLSSVWAHGQETRVELSSIDHLAAKAINAVDVTVDGSLLKIASKFLSQKRSPDDEKLKDIMAMLTGVYVKHLEFGSEADISDADIQQVRTQLQSPGWSKAAAVRSRKDSENVDVFVMADATHVKSIVVIVRKPKELTLVNVVGTLDPERISMVIGELGGHFGIPQLDLGK